jgi:pilus assembly protein CpaD
MTNDRLTRTARAALALSLVATLGACAAEPANRTLYSIHQPVVEHSQYALDVTTGPGGLSAGEAEHLAGWFEAMHLHYGDRISVDDPLGNPASRYGLLVGNEAPVTAGYVNGGTARIIVTRATASVPHCPDWSDNSDADFRNGNHVNYGCAINSNLAAMIANPDDLLHGATGSTQSNVTTSDRAIQVYSAKTPTGAGDLKATSSKSGG